MILLIDNYDSFVYNLARYVGELGFERKVVRNDKITLEEVKQINPSHIIISPGPCTPNEAGISLALIKEFAPKIPILGVCLGHQAIGQVFGARVSRAKNPMHGKSSFIKHDEKKIFRFLKNPLCIARYHSLILNDENFPNDLIVTSRCEIGEIMSVCHRVYPVYGVQFHPESILTQEGHKIILNFLSSNE